MFTANISSRTAAQVAASLAIATLAGGADIRPDVGARSLYDQIVLTPFQAPAQPANTARLTTSQQLGKDIFFDRTLSNPVGYSCASCHVPETGFTGPSSAVNILAGPVPGVIAGRVGKRKPQAVTYAAFSPPGPSFDPDLEVYLGGNFWDGRAQDTAHQGRMPILDQNEMANTPAGPNPPLVGGFSPLVAQKLRVRPYSNLFTLIYGPNVFRDTSDEQLYALATALVADYEASPEVVQFSSKYDNSKFGVPASNRYVLSASEERGRQLFFDKAQCFQCHNSEALPSVLAATGGKNPLTMYCYANVGVPRNLLNPFYEETDAASNPVGYNPLGQDFVDYGLGMNPNPGTDGTMFMNQVPGDIPQFRGLFKAPSVRNADKRPSPAFVKAYFHNGVFKSLEEVVHFYNKRNIALDGQGNEVSFDLREGPPPGFIPLFDPPEVLDNAQNAAGLTPDEAGDEVATNGQVGNLQLSSGDEADLVAFLKTLTDGYSAPSLPARPAPK